MSDSEHAVIGPNEEIKVTKIETFVLKNSWVFVKISTDAGITGWGEMLKDDAKACAAGALDVAELAGSVVHGLFWHFRSHSLAHILSGQPDPVC